MDPTDKITESTIEHWDRLLEAHLGPAGATLAWTLVWVAAGVLGLVFWRYVGVLGSGAEAQGTPERTAYENLRASLSAGGGPTRIYGRLLTVFLDGVDRFCGDRDHRDRNRTGVLHHAFGMRGAHPLWTSAAFDRCLLVALLYPIVSILLVWAVSGHVGSAEHALGLRSDLSPWRRSGAVAALWLGWFASRRTRRKAGSAADLLWLSLCAIAPLASSGIGAFSSSVGFAGGCGLILIGLTGPMFARRGAAYIIISVIVIGAMSEAGPGATSAVVSATLAAALSIASGAFFALLFLDRAFRRYQWRGSLQVIFLIAMALACLAMAPSLARSADWPASGAIVLFLGLLTVINTPFDWVSLGLTRALLRRGVELQGLWPYGLALLDAALALPIVVALAGTMVIGVQAFNLAASVGGSAPALPLGSLFDRIASLPGDPANWWVYALLVSTLIPCVANLLIGSAALTRGVPGISTLLVRAMPVDAAVPKFDRAWIAAVLTAQWAIGGALMIAAFVALWFVVRALVPEIGTWFLEYARWVATLDVPRRAVALAGH